MLNMITWRGIVIGGLLLNIASALWRHNFSEALAWAAAIVFYIEIPVEEK